MNNLRLYRRAIGTFLLVLTATWQITQPLQGATFYWDTDTSTGSNNALTGVGLGGTGTWDVSTPNWWPVPSGALTLWGNTIADQAIFSGVYPALGTPTLNTVTLSGAITANKLSFFRSGYTLTGGTSLTLAGAGTGLFTQMGESVSIESLIAGNSGLTKTGGGAIRLAAGNTYTGSTIINDGSLIITNQSALGNSTDAVTITRINPATTSTATRGFGGGSLVLDATGGNINFTRDLILHGHGPIADRGAALVSTGVNTLSGTVEMSGLTNGANVSTRVIAADGTLNLTGTLNVQGAAATTISNLGGVNQAGASFYNVTGVLTGTGTLEGSGGGTLFLNPSDSSGFSGTIRVSGSAASGQSVVRIDSPGVLGTRTSTGTGSVLDLNGGILAVLMDAPDVKVSNGTNANVYGRASSTIFADHTPNSSVKDQTVAFGQLAFEDNITITFNSRNGYGMSFGVAPVVGTTAGDNNSTFTNNLQGGGLLTFVGNFWSNSNNTGNRTMTIGGNGNTLINGGIIATAAAFDHILTKTGTGTLTLTGTTSTLDGAVNVNGGTVAINDWRAITNNTSNVNINGGILSLVGNNVSLTNMTTSKVINLSGTTGSATILANQTGTSPGVVFNANFTASGAGTKTLTLGGTNIGANTINGAIVQNGTTNVTKIDAGRWILAGTNTYTGATTISNGTLQLKANAAASTIIADTSGITFGAVNNYAGGTLEFVGQPSTNNVEMLGAITYAAGGAATIKLTPGSGGTASLVFPNISTGAGGTINFVGGDFTSNKFTITQINAAAGSDGIITRSIYWNGADFAYRQGGVLRAPAYGVDSGTVTSSTTLAAGHNEITGSFSTNSTSISTLKINGGHTLTLNGGQTLTLSGLGLLATGGSATITGGNSLTVGAANTLVVRVDGGADSLRIETPLTGFTGGLTKSGAGTLVLAGANTQTGAINIAEGTVRLSGGTLGGAAALTIRQDGILELNGVTPNNINAFINNGVVRNTSGTTDVFFTVGGSNGTGDSRGIIEDGGVGKISVIKIGTGGQNWLGLSTYTGTTTIGSTGIVGINNLQNGGQSSGIGASSNAAGNLIFNGTSATQAYGGLSYTGTTNDETDRLFTFDGGADGGVRIQSNGVNGATSTWSNPGALAFGPNAAGNPQGLVLGGASTGDNRFFPVINDNGAAVTSLYKADAGAWHLMSTNGYSGATTLTAGTLYANDGTSLPTASNLVFNGGNFASTGAFSRTIGTGSGQMQWAAGASGGFSAGGSPLTVDWGAGNVWGTTVGFLGTGALLLNNSGLAKSDVTIVSGFDLGGGTRTVTVGDFTSVGADFATISGAIIGTGSLTKNGAGILNLRGANLYTGNTNVTQGTLVVTSLGNSSSAANTATSVGVSGNTTTFDNSNAITLGNGTTTGGILEYVGLGETSDRKIRLNTTTGGNQIHADGVGPLILTNLANDMTAGAKTLSLRGVSSAANFITSQLSDNGGALAISIDGSTAWILTNPLNNYTGTTTVGAGSLGIGDNAALGTGNLDMSNGTVFSYGADRTITNAVRLVNNATTAFIGDYSFTASNPFQLLAAANNVALTNNVVGGKSVTFAAGVVANAGLTANRTWTIDGSGETNVAGNFTTSSTAFGVNLSKTGNGVLLLGGAGANANNFNQNNAGIDIDRGTIRLGASEVIGHGLDLQAVPIAYGSLTLSPELAGGDIAIFDLNGFNETINGLTANTDGTAIIDNTAATAASLTFGANNSAVSFGGGIGTYTIQNSGGGALSITKTGSAIMSIPTGVTLTYTGSTNVNGGALNIASAVNGTTALSATGASTLALTGGIANPGVITSVEVGGGSLLNLLDGAGSLISNLTTLSLGNTGAGTVTLNFNIGDSATDRLTLLSGGTLNLGNTITFNMTDTGLSAGTTYTLLNSISGGLSGLGLGNFIQGATPGGFDGFTWNVTDNLVQITTGNLIIGTSYWRGLTNNTWNANANNWSQDKAGAIAALSTPGQGTDVIFQWDALTNAAVVTTLEQNFKVNSLTFEASTTPANTPISVAIDPGVIATNRLEIAPQLATDGIKITAGGPAAVTISGPVRLGGTATSQTWNVADATSTLSIGSLLGERDVTKTGLGKVTLSAAADPIFNSGVTADFIINAGTLEILNSASLGNTINANLATVTVNNTGVFYYNGAAGTVANNLTLGGGTLSAGGGNQTYSGTVNVSTDSFINMRNNNGGIAELQERSITLSGVVSGSGNLTVDSDVTLSSGNAISGNLTLNNAANAWTGDLFINQGTVTFGALASPGITANDVTFSSLGKVAFQGVNATTLNRIGALTYAAGSIGEFNVDNTSGTLGANYLVNQNSAVTLGSGGTGASVRLFLADVASAIDIGGSVTLGGNTSISVAGGDADSFATISGIIGDGGSGHGLVFNDDAGGWGQTNTIIRLTGANTFTGNITLASGTLQYNTVTNISGGASALGNGTAINFTASSVLSFIGSSAQSTDRPITSSAGVITLSANGATAADTITYNGAITVGPTADGSQIVLSGAAGRAGIITGGITQTLDTADMTVNGGTWTHQTGTSRIGDALTVTGADTIFNLNSGLFQVRNDLLVVSGANLNLNATGVLSFNTATLSADSSLRAYTDGIITLGANDAVVATEFDGLRIGTDGTGVGTLNMATFNQTVTEFILGNRNFDRTGIVNGTGVLTVTGNLDLYKGTINANLASTGTTALEKIGNGTVTLSGDNSGLASTGASIHYEGDLVLDYTTSNTTKLRAASQLDMRGSNLILNGNASAATSQSVGSFTLGSGGSSRITLNPGVGQEIVLNLNAITRAVNAQDGTIRFILPSGTQSATNGITTDTLNTIGTAPNAIIGGWATVDNGSGVFFAANATNAADGNIVAATTTSQDAVGSWLTGENISDVTGFTGTLNSAYINSLRLNAASGSDLTLGSTGVLGINSGGILVTSSVAGTPSIVNGTLFSGYVAATPELIVTQDSSQTFQIGADIRVNHAVYKTGAGTLLLNGNNVYSGVTEIQDGTLQVTGNSIGDTSVVTLSASRPSTLELLADETIGRLQGGSRNTDSDFGTVAVGSHALTINNSGGNTTFAGFFTGDGNIIKQGTHNLNLSNLSTGFTGILTVESGLLQLSGIGQINANIIRVNKGGNLLIDNNGTTVSTAHILDTTGITLNSADGTFQGQTIVRGLAIRNDNDATRDETVGVLTLNTGASYIGMEATSTNDDSDIIINNLVRLNSSTLNVRGTNLGGALAQENEFRIGDATNQTNFIANAANLVGGGGAAATQNISIVPWMIGQSTGGALAATHMGNSLVTYISGSGFRPLLDTEYNTFGTQVLVTDNVRESLAAPLALASGPAKTINALVLHNASLAAATHAVTGAGAGESLAVTSGAMLFTLDPAAVAGDYGITLGGFDAGITVGATNEYVIHVVNPDAGAPTKALTATISSPLSSAADITKSGRGTLILSAVNAAGGGANRTTINEGILEIADLDNIGGNTGSLIFAGGTLRLGTTLTDDISLRTITLLDGGGTIDTNTINLALANSVGSGLGGLTKVGLGNLTLNAAATYTGATVVSGGTLTVGTNNATGVGGPLSIGAGATLALGANNITTGLVTTSGADPVLSGTGVINASAGFFFDHDGGTDLVTVEAVLAGPGGVFKANRASNLTLNGLNTYTGSTEVQQGILSINSITNVNGGASSLGNAANVESGIIRMGITTAATTLNYTGAGHTSNRLIGMQGTTGSVTLDADGTGALILTGGTRFEMAGNKSLILRGSSDALTIDNSIGGLTESGGVLTLNKADANTWLINGGNTYTGATQVDNGILKLGVTNALPTATAVRVGTGATAGTLDLNGFDQTIGSLTVQSTSNAVTNNIIVDTGNTLTINGAVTLGIDANAVDTNVNASGGGSIIVNSGGANFIVGAATGGTNDSRVDADFSGLTNFTANLGTGIFRLGDVNTGTETNPSTFKLAVNNNITASIIRVGDGAGGSFTHTLTLGSGTNSLNTDTINIGSTGATIRSGGAVVFDGLDTTGSVTIRASNGTDRAVINVINTTGTTAGDMVSNLGFAGHTADILASTLTMALRSSSTGAATSTLTFDQGTLDVTTLTMASRTGAGTGNATATLNLGDSAALGTPTTTIGAINMAVNTSAGGTVGADINVTGGIVNVGDGLNTGTAINMANAGTGRTVTSNFSLTGGIVNMTGDIIRTGGAGTEIATINLNGSSLAMSGNSIGAVSQAITFAAQSGSLSGLAELNGGGVLDKTTAGILNLGNGNAYTGGTTLSAGTLFAANTLGSATGSGAVSTLAGSVLGGTGIIAPGSGAAVTVNGTLQVGGTSPVAGQTLTIATNAAALTINNLLTFDLFSGEASGTLNAATHADRLLLTGNSNGATVVLGASSIFEITTSLNTTTGWAAGSSWQLIDWAGLTPTGTFSNLTGGAIGNFANLPDLSPQLMAWDVSNLYSTGIVSVVVIPEPSRALLLMFGILALFMRRRRIE